MARSTLTSKGQITIPKAIRERLGLRVGERLEFRIGKDERIVMERTWVHEPRKIAGLLKHLAPEKPVSVEEMKRAVAERVGSKARRFEER